MATTLLSSITRTGTYPLIVQGIEAPSNCGTLQLILGSDWTLQMIHELPAINISIYTNDDAKYIDFDIDMSTVNSEYRNKERSLEPIEPYSVAIYNIPENFYFKVLPLFDKNALESHNAQIDAGDVSIFNTTEKGIVDSNMSEYDSEKWAVPTATFDITIVFDNSNISSSGGGSGETPTAADISYDGSVSGLSASTVQTAIDEVQQNINELPEPMIFKGSLGTGGTITSLPTASADNKGFTYKVITAGTYQGTAAEIGDTFISDGSTWVLIPSGDEPSGTVTNVAVSSTDGSATITGSPITSSGTIDIAVPTVSYDSTNAKLQKTLAGVTSDVMTVDTTPTTNSKNPVTSGAVSNSLALKADLSMFTPMTQAQYDALQTKDLPIYFIYEPLT